MDMTGIDELQDLLILFTNGSITDINIEDNIPEEFTLYQNYPNPFNPTTKIKFTIPIMDNLLPGGARGGLVTLKVYDVLGDEITMLVNEEKSPGTYEVDFNSHSGLSGIKDLPSGIYFYTLNVGQFSQTKKMILLK
jgi:hypothetical protein